MNLFEFTTSFIEDIRNDSIIQGTTPGNVFLEDMINRLQSMEYLFNPTILPFYKPGSNGRIMKFDMYAYDEIDKSFVLLSNEYNDDVNISTLNSSEIKTIAQRMLNYIDETYNATIFKYIDASQDAYRLAEELKDRLYIDHIDLNNYNAIEKIKLFIITNKKLSNRVSNLKLEEYYERQVELNVWDIDRIYEVISSGRDKEPIIIDFHKFNGGEGIPFLKANFEGNIDYDAYLSILPGKLLSDIYWEHGSRLLEGNVRAFLSAKGKVNKGIRNTINKDPGKFFTYNNGIACTAKSLEFSPDEKFITKIEDLQIINGGQTTASLTTAWKKDKATLEKIYVPMKLTIIRSEDYEDMVQNISRYANSQNKVTDADLFSNHPFHIAFEKLSQKYPAPAKAGENHNTFWYYERSRGKYQQSQFKISKKSELDTYLKKYPKNQVIQKEDLAKYLMTGIYLRPDLVSKGRSKNMSEFAIKIDEVWKKDKSIFNEVYFKQAICYAIMFKEVDILVAKAEWYQVGGIKLNIVPYAIAKLIDSVPKGMSVDLNRIWREQQLYRSFIDEAKVVAKLANDFINRSYGVIVTEYAKKQETWEKFRKIAYTPSQKFINDLVKSTILEDQLDQAKKGEKENQKISIELEVYNLAKTENGMYWNRLLDEGLKRNLITISEENIIKNYIIELSKPNPKVFPSEMQYKVAWEVRKRLDKQGVLV